MKKIAITQRLILNDSYYELREALDVRWGALFEKLDFLPIVLPTEFDFTNYFEQMQIDGVLLTGGNDLSSINDDEVAKKRDIFEFKLIEYAIAKDIPILGVCRGMQVIADYFGAKFVQADNQVAVRHKLIVNKDSKYFNELSKIEEVNSFHNYAVEKLPTDFILSCSNEDGMIKAIEHKKHKIFGLMWHSEREEDFDANELALMKKFFGDLEFEV